MLATSHLTGKKVNRFTNLHQSTDDLLNKVKMLRLLGQKTGSCFQRCVGMDALNALWSVTYEIDQANWARSITRGSGGTSSTCRTTTSSPTAP